MITRPLIIFLFILCLITWGTQLSAKTESDDGLNKVMTQIGNVMVELFPLVFTDNILTSQQNQKIRLLANQLKVLFKNARPYIRKKSPTYQMSYRLITDYLEAVVNTDNPFSTEQVKSRLSTLSDFCISCHMQDDKFRTLFGDTKKKLFNSALARAEFNYATRNYSQAHEHYEKHLIFSPKLNDNDILKGIFKILSIYTQILNQPAKAVDALNRLQKEKAFSKEVTKYITDAKRALNDLQASDTNDTDLLAYNDIEKFVALYLGGVNAQQGIIFSTTQEEVQRLWLRGQLFRYLNNKPKANEIPNILYWLALCDRSLGHGYDYTLADFYIKQCIIRYSSHPIAQQCFDEHKEYLKFYYTTPTEPVLPFEVNNELKKLERYLHP